MLRVSRWGLFRWNEYASLLHTWEATAEVKKEKGPESPSGPSVLLFWPIAHLQSFIEMRSSSTVPWKSTRWRRKIYQNITRKYSSNWFRSHLQQSDVLVNARLALWVMDWIYSLRPLRRDVHLENALIPPQHCRHFGRMGHNLSPNLSSISHRLT